MDQRISYVSHTWAEIEASSPVGSWTFPYFQRDARESLKGLTGSTASVVFRGVETAADRGEMER
jgi:hypothetical protein